MCIRDSYTGDNKWAPVLPAVFRGRREGCHPPDPPLLPGGGGAATTPLDLPDWRLQRATEVSVGWGLGGGSLPGEQRGPRAAAPQADAGNCRKHRCPCVATHVAQSSRDSPHH
eukprot:4934929-Alexandrium_andersonii.AAC.1